MPTWILFALLSAIFAALVAIFGKIGLTNVDSTMATAVRSVVMAVFLVIVMLASGKLRLVSTLSGRAFEFIVLSGIAGALSWLFYFFALRAGPASSVAAIDRLSVVFVLIFAILMLGERLIWQSALGAVLIVCGAILMTIR